MKSATSSTLAALALVGNVAAFWRMPCRSHTGIARIDPLVAPGSIADHAHIVFGGGNFGDNATYEDLTKCKDEKHDCTSCGVTQDKSAYWTPPLYFQYENGSTEMVPNVGGMLAYYLFYLDNLQPFPEGFQMISGDPTIRNFTGPFPDAELSSWPTDPTDQFFLHQRAIGFNCLNYDKDPEASLYRHTLPDKAYLDANCKDGLRLEMAFPSCGTGEKDSENHRDHVAFPSLVKEGNCPEGYDVHYPFLFYETIFATQQFAGKIGQFVLSTGDPIGTSYHADFIMGWESADYLGQAIDTCTNMSGNIQDCSLFNIQSDNDAAQCAFETPADLEGEDCEGTNEGLPYRVPIQYGPEPATAYPVYGVDSAATSMQPTAKPSSFSQPAVSYSPANPTSTAAAQGGIVVAAYSSGAEGASAPAVTSAPAPAPASSDHPDCYTTYITNGYEVIEMVVIETDVTITASGPAPAAPTTASTTAAAADAAASAPAYQAPPPAEAAPAPAAAPAAPAYNKHKRHVEKHQHAERRM